MRTCIGKIGVIGRLPLGLQRGTWENGKGLMENVYIPPYWSLGSGKLLGFSMFDGTVTHPAHSKNGKDFEIWSCKRDTRVIRIGVTSLYASAE